MAVGSYFKRKPPLLYLSDIYSVATRPRPPGEVRRCCVYPKLVPKRNRYRMENKFLAGRVSHTIVGLWWPRLGAHPSIEPLPITCSQQLIYDCCLVTKGLEDPHHFLTSSGHSVRGDAGHPLTSVSWTQHNSAYVKAIIQYA